MVYRDEARHLVADSFEELHAFAEKAGIKRGWFDADSPSRGGGGKPHYDIPKFVLRESSLLLSMETKLVSSREILTLSKKMRDPKEIFARSLAETMNGAKPVEEKLGFKLGFIADLIRKEIPGASRQQAESAARQIMYQLSIKEDELIGSNP